MNRQELIENVIRASEHDERAFTLLYAETYPDMFILARRMCRKIYDVEDILQESYSEAYFSLSELTQKGKFRSWLKDIVVKNCSDVRRKKIKLDSTYEFISFEEICDNEDDSLMDYSECDSFEIKVRNEELWQLIHQLSEKHRSCLIMFYYYEMSAQQIAERLHIPEGSVKSRLYYGRQNIKRMLEDDS